MCHLSGKKVGGMCDRSSQPGGRLHLAYYPGVKAGVKLLAGDFLSRCPMPVSAIFPCLDHNYELGELFAAQLRHVLAGLAGHTGPASELSFNGRKDFGEYLARKVFRPGRTLPWPEFVKEATGQPLTAMFFAEEVK